MNLHKDDTRAFLEYLGFNVDNHYKFKMREDEKTASASIDPKNGYIKDFGSGFRGDVIAFYKEVKGCDERSAFLEVAAILDSLKVSHNLNTQGKKADFTPPPLSLKALSEQQNKEQEIVYLDENIMQKYETERRENFARYSELLSKLLPTCDNATRKDLAQNFQIGYSKSEDRLVMPLRDEKNGIVTLWKYNPNLNIKYSFSKERPRCAFNTARLQEYAKSNEPIFIAEGEKDCLNMLSRGYKAVSFGSATVHLKQEQVKMLKDCYVVVAYDYDEAGKNGAKALKEQLNGVCKVVEIIDWEKILKKNGLENELKKGFDFTDFLEISSKQREIKKGIDR